MPGGDDQGSSYIDRKTGKVKTKARFDAWANTRKTKGGETSSVGGGWAHKKRMAEDDAYYNQVKAEKKASDKAGFGGRLKKLGGAVSNLGKMGVDVAKSVATNPAGMVMLGAAGAYMAGANLAGGVGAVGTGTASTGASAGLGASLHAGGAAVSPIGTAGMSAAGAGSGIAGAGSAGLSTMEGGRNALSVGKTLSGSGGITGMIKGGLSGMSDLKDWTKLGLAGADMIGSIAGGFADAGDAKDAQKAANPFAKYRDKYAMKLGELYDNPESIRETPGYKFRFDEGMRAVNRTSAAKGHRLSGNVLLEASRYGQGLADQMRGEEIDRLGGLAGATMGFSNAGYTQRGSKVGGINEALGTAGDFIGRTNYWDDDDEANT